MMRSTTIDYAELVAALSRGGRPPPVLLNALDYRYFAQCHLPGSLNMYEMALRCDAARAQRHDEPGGRDVAALAASGGGAASMGGSHVQPYAAVAQATQSGADVVVYCANAA
jgi:hypothetical protein